ncbi:type II CAAX endopeptidase family protein [Micrococcaceae bacterium Sec7.4]
MSNHINIRRARLRTVGVLAGALALYVSAALAATLLSGSAVVGALVSNAAAFAAGLFWLRTQPRREGSEGPVSNRGVLGQGRGFWALTAASLALCWIVGQAASVWLYSLVGSAEFDQHAAAKSSAPIPLTLLLVLILAPMGEEMLMRGVAYTRLRRHLPPLAAAVVTAAVFSLLHLNLVQIVATLPLGLLLAAVYEQTGRLAPVIGLHAVFNLLSVIVPVALVSSLSSLTFVLLGGSGLALLLVQLYKPLSAVSREREVAGSHA